MYDEPYRWVEAVGNRRQYLDDQFRQGSPLVAISYGDGIVLLTTSHGTPKLYEIYDRIALGGMGHPADLEKLRFAILDMAHTEGFQRSPGDVTGSRLIKYGLAPAIKQAFEEIFKAPYISKLLLAELGNLQNQDRFFTVDYDGTFEEHHDIAVIGATPDIQEAMSNYVKKHVSPTVTTLQGILEVAVRTWAVGALSQHEDDEHPEGSSSEKTKSETLKESFSEEQILEHLRTALTEKTLECAVLERQGPGSSKYRTVSQQELHSYLPILNQTTK
jgi:proteasome alpha subunit